MTNNDLNPEKELVKDLFKDFKGFVKSRFLHSTQKTSSFAPKNDRKLACGLGFHGEFGYTADEIDPPQRVCKSCGAIWILNTCCGSTRWERYRDYE